MSQAIVFDSQAWGSQEVTAAAAESQAFTRAKDTEAHSETPGPRAAKGAAVVVVGAGFAGLLAAHFLAAAHGCRVEVYDKRAHPGPLPMRAGDEDEDDRAFALSMNVRGSAAVAAAGLDPDFAEVPGAHMALVRDQVMARGDGLPARGGDRGSTLTVPFAQPRVVGSRQAFVRALLHQIERAAAARGGGGGIAFAWGASFVSADLAARTATFQLGDGSTVVRPYDLLVGADGYYSRVRRAAAAQAPQLVVETSPPNRQYKVVRGLRPVAHLPLGPVPGSGGCGRMYMVQEAAAGLRGAGGGAPATLFLSQPSEECGVTAVLTMAHPRWQGLQGREQYARLLAASFPSLPPAWAEEMSAQLAVRPLFETGMQARCSQLHAAGLVLLGDAAHAVSPATSNGMNSALEDVLVLSASLERVGGDLAALPAAFTRARLQDAHALQWLDRAMSAMAGRGGDGAAYKLCVAVRMLLGKATGGWVRPHAFVALKDGSLPYAEARRAAERDAALARVLTTGAGVTLVAGAAATALGTLRGGR